MQINLIEQYNPYLTDVQDRIKVVRNLNDEWSAEEEPRGGPNGGVAIDE